MIKANVGVKAPKEAVAVSPKNGRAEPPESDGSAIQPPKLQIPSSASAPLNTPNPLHSSSSGDVNGRYVAGRGLSQLTPPSRSRSNSTASDLDTADMGKLAEQLSKSELPTSLRVKLGLLSTSPRVRGDTQRSSSKDSPASSPRP